ncbi:unnamed protein product [Rodentolepis nana]|uniref:RNase H domain-containing protein n=1 Tax=Rodentolepis nana TaxID=102285 RepID=A0A0R3TJJ4_RODNA|nr:unnamed protein product [Rodentolepis nana]
MWKSHIAKIAERVSNRLNVLKRLAGSVWGCARSTLNTTYKMFIQQIMLYCCEPLITATEVTLKPLEKAHNQALRLITGGIKSTPIDAMLLVTGSTTICSLIKEKALILTYENRPRHLKAQSGLKQKAIELKKSLQIDGRPKSLPLLMNPLADTDVVCCTQLLDYFRKSNIPPEQMHSLAFETINVNYLADQWLQVFDVNYPADQWLQVFTESQGNVGAGVYSELFSSMAPSVYSELFSFYAAATHNRSAIEGEIEAMRIEMCQLCCLDTKFTKAVTIMLPGYEIHQSSDTSGLTVSNRLYWKQRVPKTAEIYESEKLYELLREKNKTVVPQWIPGHCGIKCNAQWIPGHCGIKGNELADTHAKKWTRILQCMDRPLSFHTMKALIRRELRTSMFNELKARTKEKQRTVALSDIPDWPRIEAVAEFRLRTGHNCLAKHLHRLGLYTQPTCPLCNL